jgi:glycosyltransferase involved in cell wall biosynthesis
LFNSHHNFYNLLRFKFKNPDKIFIHRLAGPIIEGRGQDIKIDKMIYFFNRMLSDATIFQSRWSRASNYKHGLSKNINEIIIINAPDSNIFCKKSEKIYTKINKIRIIASSWSTNSRKGFSLYQYLDKNLDFNKFEMIFVGNSPVSFKNIKIIKPLKSKELAKKLQESDVYITASKGETCSNSLIEALHCGLPSIGLNDGGNPSIIGSAGEVFDGEEDVIKNIDLVVKNYSNYKKMIDLPNIDLVADKYFRFMKNIFDMTITHRYTTKHVGFFNYLFLFFIERYVYYTKKVTAIIRKIKTSYEHKV